MKFNKNAFNEKQAYIKKHKNKDIRASEKNEDVQNRPRLAYMKSIKKIAATLSLMLLFFQSAPMYAETVTNEDYSIIEETDVQSDQPISKNNESSTSINVDDESNIEENSDLSKQENAPNDVQTIDLFKQDYISETALRNLYSEVDEETKVEVVSGIMNEDGVFENYSEPYWQVELDNGMYAHFPQRYGTKEDIIDGLKSNKLFGVSTNKETNPLEEPLITPFLFLGDQWDIPMLTAYDKDGVLRPVYCVDGKLNYPALGSYPQWNTVGAALGNALYYVVSNLSYGYPQNYGGGMIGTADEQQLGTGGAIWWNMSVYRANSRLDWSDSRNPGTGGYSAYHEQSTAGANMRYLVGKGNHIPDVLIYINGISSGLASFNSNDALENISGVTYQTSEWIPVTGDGVLYFSVPEPYKMQRENGTIFNAGDHSCEAGGQYRILNPDLSDGSEWRQSTTSSVKKMGLAYGVVGGDDQDVVMGLSSDPIPTPEFSVQWQERKGNVTIPKTIIDDTLNKNYNVDYSKFTIEIFNADGVSQGLQTISNATKDAVFNDLLIGGYTWVETNNDPNVNTILGRGSFTIIPGQTITLDSGSNPTNEISGGYITGTKAFINNSTETYPWDYTKISYRVQGDGIDKTYKADATFSFKTDRLKLGTYTVTEINTDAGTVIVNGTATVSITTNNQTIVLDGNNQITNTVANVDVRLLKKDAEWLTPILKPAGFTMYDYDVSTDTLENPIASGNINLIGEYTFKNIQIGSTGKREVIILEDTAPDGYFLDTRGVRLTLTTEQHTQTITFDYYNVPEFFTSPEVIKTNHLGVPLADIPFVLERLDANGKIVEEVEHILTNKVGFARFQNIPSNDQDNKPICYQIRELRSEDNKYYILDQPYKFCGDKNVKIVKYQAVNEPKKFVLPIHKIAEANPVGITSDNSIWGFYNTNDELIDQATILNNYGELTDVTYEQLGEDISSNYWQEISTGNDALVLDTNKYYLPETDWMTIEDGDSISVVGNTAETPFVNKIKRVAVESLKLNEYGKPLQDVEFDLFAQDTILEEGTEQESVVQNKVESLVTDATGKFVTSYYPIYMFNGTDLSYMQEIATLENLVLITQKYNVPVIDAANYANYSDGQVIPLNEDNAPIINYNLRLNLGFYKMNEDHDFLPGVTYGLYDQDKRQLATVVSDDEGLLYFENIRFDVFINYEDLTAENTLVYIREIKVQDEDKYSLNYQKIYLPNLYGKQNDYAMNDTIWLNTKDTAYVNNYLTGDVELVKVDEQQGELPLANATFKFERLTGKDIENDDTEDTAENTNPIVEEETTDNNEESNQEERQIIDVKQSFELTTDANGMIEQKDLLYGDWCVTEINAPEGYILPVDEQGVPNNTLCFTIDAATQKISMKFYNQKAPELLVETGDNTTQLMFALGLGMIALFGALFIYARRKKMSMNLFSKIAIVLLLTVATSGVGVTLAANSIVTTKTAEIATMTTRQIVTVESNSSVTNAIDPLDPNDPLSPTDPIEGTNPTPGDDSLVGDKPEQPSQDDNQPVEQVSDDTSDTTYSDTTNWGGSMPKGGELTFEVIIGSLTVLTASCLAFFVLKFAKLNKRDDVR